jgi:hypothetical protein
MVALAIVVLLAADGLVLLAGRTAPGHHRLRPARRTRVVLHPQHH